jgi:hypothetical protein
MPNSTRRAMTASISASVARSFITTTMALPSSQRQCVPRAALRR